MKDKHYKPFFVTDADGRLFKAVPLKDEDIPNEDEEEKKTLKAAGVKQVDEPAGDKPEAVLTADDIAALKEMIAAHKAAKEEQKPAEGDVHDEDDKVDVEEDKDKEEKVIDTAAKDSAKKGFGSVQKQSQPVQDSNNNIEVEDSWQKRYGK